MEQELKEKFEADRKLFFEDNPQWQKYFSDSMYYDMQDWYASKHGFEFEDEKGYPDEVYEFSNYVWDKIIWGEDGPVKWVAVKDMPNGIKCILIRLKDNGFKYAVLRNAEHKTCLEVDLYRGENGAKKVTFDVGVEDIMEYDAVTTQEWEEITIYLVPKALFKDSSEFVRINFEVGEKRQEL